MTDPRDVLTIRPGVAADLETVVSFNQAMARETEDLELDSARLQEGVQAVLEGRVPAFYRLLEQDGRVIGQLMITLEWSDWRNRQVWWIQSVYLMPEARGRGHFRRLYETMQEEARTAGAAGLRLYVDRRNVAAQAVYHALGMDGAHYQVFEALWETS